MNKLVKKAVFPVGGLGTRFLPATKAMPKEMLPIMNKPLIQYAFEEARNAGIEQFIFITGRNKNTINNHFDHAYELEHTLSDKDKLSTLSIAREWLPEPGNLIFIRQQKPLGLGHAIWCAKEVIGDEPFAVLLADELFLTDSKKPLLQEMLDNYTPSANIIATAKIAPEDVYKYGIVSVRDAKRGPIREINGMVEKPACGQAPSNLSITGRYILQPEIFNILANTVADGSGEIQLTDAMKALLEKNKFYSLEVRGKRLDCGNPIGWIEANLEMAMSDPNISSQVADIFKKTYERFCYA